MNYLLIITGAGNIAELIRVKSGKTQKIIFLF